MNRFCLARLAVAFALCSSLSIPLSATAADDAPQSNVGRRYRPELKMLADEVTGLEVKALTTSTFNDVKPYQTHTTWTSDGEWILFRSDRSDNGRQAFAVPETTGDIIQLTDDPRTRVGSLNLSRQEMKLYYMRGGSEQRRRGEPPAEPRMPLELVELDIGALIADSLANEVKEPEHYLRIVATLPDGLRDSGGFALVAMHRNGFGRCGATVRATSPLAHADG